MCRILDPILANFFVVVQPLSCIQPFAPSWTAVHQASLSFTLSWSLFRLMSIESGKPCSHPPSLHPSPLAFNLSQHQGLFQWVISSHQVAKYWSFSFSISASNEYLALISFKIDPFDILAVERALKNLLQDHCLKASVLQCPACIMVQHSHPHPHMTTGKTTVLTIWTFAGKEMSLLFNMLNLRLHGL